MPNTVCTLLPTYAGSYIDSESECKETNSTSQKILGFFQELLFLAAQLLHVDGVLPLQTLQNRRFVILLAATEFTHYAGFLKFSLKLLQRALDVLAFFYGYYNHALFLRF